MRKSVLPVIVAMLGAAWCFQAAAADAAAPPAAPASDAAPQGTPASPHTPAGNFAVVNGTTISAVEFDQAARTGFRQKFYHGKPPEAEVKTMLRDTGQSLIDRLLLTQEVEKRQIKPDKAAVDRELASYETRYANSPAWKEQREKALPQLRAFIEEKSRLAVLEDRVRTDIKINPEEVRRYYDEHQEAFTEPEKIRVSTILLKVDPSSTSEIWARAMSEGEMILGRLKAGADFAETAKLQSGDAASAESGGDMGYVHRGMLGEDVHAALDKVKPGEIVGPLRLLQGVALFKLVDRREPKLQPFEAVAARAEGLLRRERSEQAWKDFLMGLRQGAKIEIDPAFTQMMQADPAATSSH